VQTFVFLTTWTDQGIQDSRNSVDRALAAVESMEQHRVKIFEVYWTTGPYDLMLVAECPDQETAHAVTLELASRGNVRCTAMRAFDRSEMTGIMARLGWGGEG
jgi:uncharacterized protein with GYD domain